MARPKTGYKTKDGRSVPGTTTVIGRFKESGALIKWAYNRGRDGLELYESRDKAAELGTFVHEMVEAFIGGKAITIPDALDKDEREAVSSAFGAFTEWFEGNAFTVISQEEQLVSEAHRYGGTIDAVAKDGKERLVLIDFKTSNGVYEDHIYQLAAYRLLWNENHPEQPLTGGSHLARFSKEHGDFAHHFFPDIAEAEEGFLLMRELYDISREVKKRC
jgi:hypothetical protein